MQNSSRQDTQAGSLRSDALRSDGNSENKWHSRGYLPHFDGSVVQFVTYRLANSLPRTFLTNLKIRLDNGQISEIEYHREIERYLDLGDGPTFLRIPDIAVIVEENLLRFDGQKYDLLHWVIMANHVHVLLRPYDGIALSSIIHSMKSFTANRANRQLRRSGPFWSIEYFDRYIRDARHYISAVAYIHANPVKARLCSSPEDWMFGCARRHE